MDMKACGECGLPIPETRRSNAVWCGKKCFDKQRFRKWPGSKGRPRRRLGISWKIILVELLGGKCVVCQSTEQIQVDHITPRFEGGEHSARNVQLLCFPCHIKKNKVEMARREAAKKDTRP